MLPFISAAASDLFNIDNYTELDNPRDLAKIFSTPDYAKWQSFRDSEDSRYVGLCLPHILMRLPYGPETVPVESFNFVEDVDGTDHSKYLWGNAAYAFATRLHRVVRQAPLVRGHTRRRGRWSGRRSADAHLQDRRGRRRAQVPDRDRHHRPSREGALRPRVHPPGPLQEHRLRRLLCAQSCQKAKLYNTDAANANARLSTQIQYIMATSRFAHYLKSMMRDKIGSFMSRSECEMFLNTWIAEYITTDPEASQELKAKRPLAEARIDVVDVAGKPGCYKAVAFLKPHFQLDELTVSLRLVAELPPPAK